jgi:hypothetical protein
MDFDLAASMHVLDSFLKVSASYPLLLQRAARRPLDVLFRSISLGEGVENRAQAHREERGGFKTALMAQKVQLHKQFISQSPVER